jgi:hypothetical protein
VECVFAQGFSELYLTSPHQFCEIRNWKWKYAAIISGTKREVNSCLWPLVRPVLLGWLPSLPLFTDKELLRLPLQLKDPQRLPNLLLCLLYFHGHIYSTSFLGYKALDNKNNFLLKGLCPEIMRLRCAYWICTERPRWGAECPWHAYGATLSNMFQRLLETRITTFLKDISNVLWWVLATWANSTCKSESANILWALGRGYLISLRDIRRKAALYVSIPMGNLSVIHLKNQRLIVHPRRNC